jgi:tetratricopeptide (TPR) repeat protein
MTQSLQPPNIFHLQAAQGWVELGNACEGNRELEKIPPELQKHPDVLKVRWEIYATQKRWEAALEVAASLVELEPENPHGWVHRSFCLHELKRTREARDRLLPVAAKFELATISYNLACYECQLGDLSQARKWLKTALSAGDRKELKLMAMADPDLKPLWPELA